ncbi:MAG: hypothetical protein I4N51_09775, partial [Acinetobacter sp.]|nr:hypothetical protein [Acinetobacter sp.]
MRTEQEIYNDIGEVILSIAPENAQKIIVQSILAKESDCGEFTYDYIDSQGIKQWVKDTKNASELLLDLLVELRTYFVENIESESGEKSFWHGCIITVDLETLKINI